MNILIQIIRTLPPAGVFSMEGAPWNHFSKWTELKANTKSWILTSFTQQTLLRIPQELQTHKTDIQKCTWKCFPKMSGGPETPWSPYIGATGPRRQLPPPRSWIINWGRASDPRAQRKVTPSTLHPCPGSPFSLEYFYGGHFSAVGCVGGGFCQFSISFL